MNGIENAYDYVETPGKDQAMKAAMWENNELLQFGRYDPPKSGEDHATHDSIHLYAEMQARQENNPNLPLLLKHRAETAMLKKQEEALATQNPLTVSGQTSGIDAGTGGSASQSSQEQLSARTNGVYGGLSQVPQL